MFWEEYVIVIPSVLFVRLPSKISFGGRKKGLGKVIKKLLWNVF